MKIVTCVFPITLGRPLENAEKMIEIAEKNPGDVYLFPAYALSGVSIAKISGLSSFKEESEKALDKLCSYTENNKKVFVTATFTEGNIAIYDGDVNKSGKFTKEKLTFAISQSGNENADIMLVPTAMPSYPCIKNDVSEFCAAISTEKKCVVAVANSGYGESTADDVFKGFCGVFKDGTITAFMSEDKPETVVAAAEYDKTTGIKYSRPKKAAGKIPYYTKNDTTLYVTDYALLQKEALYSRAKFMGVKKLFVEAEETSEGYLALYILSETAKDLKMKSEKVTVFTCSDNIAALARKFGFSVISDLEGSAREIKAKILDRAEKEKALVVGTVTLSDLAYGEISPLCETLCHYNINATLPRTVLWDEVKTVYKDAAETLEKVSAVCEKEKDPKTDLCDFWVYYFAKHGMKSTDLLNYALATFDEYDDDVINGAFEFFKPAYIKNQQIRSAEPEGANAVGFILPYIPTDAVYDM